MLIYDVAVIGAGPAGCMAAKYAALNGARTVILEEHRAAGFPVQCAGLLGNRAIEESELSRPRFLMAMRGATVFSPGGFEVSFKAREEKAWVVDRRIFDREMALEAVGAGAELRLGSVVRRATLEGDVNVLCLGGGDEVRSRVVITAEGVRAALARRRGIPRVKRILSGAQVEAPFQVGDPEKVELYFGLAPGLFAWVIPTSADTARVGLCAKDVACRRLEGLLHGGQIRSRFKGHPVDLVVGGLPLGPPDRTVADGILAVGDAAGQVKPTSGGGVYPGLVCAKICGKVAADASLEGDVSAARLSEYDRLWRRRIGRELEVGMRINEMIDSLGAGELDEIIAYLAGRPGLIRVIEEHGDVDRPSLLLARMLPMVGVDGIKLARLLKRALV